MPILDLESSQKTAVPTAVLDKRHFESRLSLLGKMVFDIANTELLPDKGELSPGAIDDTEGQSIVEKFLIHICPIFEEEIIKKIDLIGKWRSVNLAHIGHIANMKLLSALSQMHLAVHPRVMSAVIEKGSLTEDPVLIEMWANLLVSASTFEQDDERYISYASLLENISPGQASVLGELGSRLSSVENIESCADQKFTALKLADLLEQARAESLSELKLDLTYLESLRLIDVADLRGMEGNMETLNLKLTPLGALFYENTYGSQ